MAERIDTFQEDLKGSGIDAAADAVSRVRADVERLVEGFDLQTVSKRVDEFGRSNPIGLALTALTVGVAVGFLMRSDSTQ